MLACAPAEPSPQLTGQTDDTTSQIETDNATALTEPDDPAASTSSETIAPTTGDTGIDLDENPCSACAADEYCRWIGADDVCQPPPFLADQVRCDKLPDGCTRASLCSAACAHQICEGYACTGNNPCELAGAVQCSDGCEPDRPGLCTNGTTCLPIQTDDDPPYDTHACVPVPDPAVPVGGACQLIDDGDWQWGNCELGAICQLLDADATEGVCKLECSDTPCPADHACVQWANGSSHLQLCEPTCDPLVLDACPAGDVCVHVDEPAPAFPCVSKHPLEGGALYDPCETINGCDPGLFCANPVAPGCDPNAAGCCVPWCDLDQPECPDGLPCVPYFTNDDAPAGHEDLGVCLD